MSNNGSVQRFHQIPALQFVPEKSSTAPANPVGGQLWTDTSVIPNVSRWFNGVAWIAADGTSIPAGFITDTLINASAGIALSKLAIDPVARANHTGTQAAATISDFDAQVRTSRLDQMAAPTSNIDYNGVRQTNVGTPVAPGDGVNKAYADNLRAGISVKDPVRVVAQGNIAIAAPGASIDGVALNAGDRFLARVQNTATENGIYTWNGPTVPATWGFDANAAGDVVDGSLVAVADGSSAGYEYIQRVTASGAPGTWSQDWGVFAIGGQTYTAGNGLAISGTEFFLDVPVTVANGGTGATTALAARANLGALTKSVADLGALTAGVAYSWTHGLGTTDVGLWLRTTDDGRSIDIDWAPSGINAINLYPDLAFGAGALHAIAIG
jgi:hypothetical protein